MRQSCSGSDFLGMPKQATDVSGVAVGDVSAPAGTILPPTGSPGKGSAYPDGKNLV